MSTTKFTKTLTKVLEKAVKKAPDALEIIQRIIIMEQTLLELQDDQRSVSSRISAWDRLKFLSTTKDERTEKGLKQRIRVVKRELKSYQDRFHSLIVNQFLKLCRKRDDFRLLQIWDQTLEIKRKIDSISCSCDEGFGTVWGDSRAKEAVSTLQTQLQGFLKFSADESVDVAFIIEQAKGNLLGYY